MAFQLRNEVDPGETVIITQSTWYGLVDLAFDHGWNPVGAVMPENWYDFPAGIYRYGVEETGNWYDEAQNSGLVMIEDALNLGDALEKAFIAYEPVYMPASYFLFNGEGVSRPSIGALLAVCDLCHKGAFKIEEYRRGYHDL